jgi:hypothetical protein
MGKTFCGIERRKKEKAIPIPIQRERIKTDLYPHKRVNPFCGKNLIEPLRNRQKTVCNLK